MKDELRSLLNEIAAHPTTYGMAAAVARWMVGDREGGLKALLGYVVASMLVAWAAYNYMADEGLTEARTAFWIILAAFFARDLLVTLAAFAQQFRSDPVNLALRIWQAVRGGGAPK